MFQSLRSLPFSEFGRFGITNQTRPNTYFFQTAGFRFIDELSSRTAQLDKSGARQQRVKLLITVATRAKLPIFQSSANEIGNLSKVCQTFCLLEEKVKQASQTCQTCRFRNWGVNQTQIPSLSSLPFSELVPIKHTLRMYQPRSQGILTSHPHHDAKRMPWYTSIKCAENMGASAAIIDFAVCYATLIDKK